MQRRQSAQARLADKKNQPARHFLDKTF